MDFIRILKRYEIWKIIEEILVGILSVKEKSFKIEMEKRQEWQKVEKRKKDGEEEKEREREKEKEKEREKEKEKVGGGVMKKFKKDFKDKDKKEKEKEKKEQKRREEVERQRTKQEKKKEKQEKKIIKKHDKLLSPIEMFHSSYLQLHSEASSFAGICSRIFIFLSKEIYSFFSSHFDAFFRIPLLPCFLSERDFVSEVSEKSRDLLILSHEVDNFLLFIRSFCKSIGRISQLRKDAANESVQMCEIMNNYVRNIEKNSVGKREGDRSFSGSVLGNGSVVERYWRSS